MKEIKVALARVNYSQLYKLYDDGKTYKKRDILIPYHLITLASHVRRRGVKVKIFDGEVDLMKQEELAQYVVSWNPQFVGLTATTPDINLTIGTCELIKQLNDQIITVVGGPHASAVPEDVAKHVCVDYVVVGDGEYPLDLIINKETKNSINEEILDGMKNDYYFAEQYKKMISNQLGKIIRGRVKTLLNQPMPAHDLLDYSKYQFTDPTRGQLNTASIMSSRGCPFNCIFCFHDRNVRLRNVDNFIDEIKYLIKEKNVKYFYIYDDTFTVNKKRVLEILKKIKELNLKDVNFQCLTRAELIDEELIKAFKEAHFVRVSMGIETGSEKILEVVCKNNEKADYVRACKLLWEAGIETRASFILGHPFETKKTLKETINFAKELDLVHANFNIMTPYPGTVVYDMALKEDGLHFKNKEHTTNWDAFKRWGAALIQTNEVSASDLEEFQKDAQMEFYTQDKVYKYYENLFKKGNNSKYFFRPLNFSWNRKYGTNIPFWDALDDTKIIEAD